MEKQPGPAAADVFRTDSKRADSVRLVGPVAHAGATPPGTEPGMTRIGGHVYDLLMFPMERWF